METKTTETCSQRFRASLLVGVFFFSLLSFIFYVGFFALICLTVVLLVFIIVLNTRNRELKLRYCQNENPDIRSLASDFWVYGVRLALVLALCGIIWMIYEIESNSERNFLVVALLV
jgi:hypothetical protein